MYIFRITLELPMPPTDYAHLDSKHFRIRTIDGERYEIIAMHLKYLVELLLVLSYNNQLGAFLHLKNIVCEKGSFSQLDEKVYI